MKKMSRIMRQKKSSAGRLTSKAHRDNTADGKVIEDNTAPPTDKAKKRLQLIAGDSSNIPFCWRNPLMLEMDKVKLTKVFRTMTEEEKQRSLLVPAYTETDK